MARINVEDSLFKDFRFVNLAIKLKNQDQAIGAVVRCWMVAQSFWKGSDHGIPKTEWRKQGLNDAIIECGLAEDLGDFVRVVGSDKHFAWLRERSEAGRNGAKVTNEKRWNRTGPAAKGGVKWKDGGVKLLAKSVGSAQQTSPSPSYSSSYSSSYSCSKNLKTFAQQVERVYQEYYPRKIGKTRGTKRLAGEMGSEDDVALLEKAVRNYAKHCEGKDPEFIKHFSSFASEWRDWIEPPPEKKLGAMAEQDWKEVFENG